MNGPGAVFAATVAAKGNATAPSKDSLSAASSSETDESRIRKDAGDGELGIEVRFAMAHNKRISSRYLRGEQAASGKLFDLEDFLFSHFVSFRLIFSVFLVKDIPFVST